MATGSVAGKYHPNKEDLQHLFEMMGRTRHILDIEDQLTESNKLLVSLILREGLSYPEAASILGISLKACYKKMERLYRSLLQRARKRDELEASNDGTESNETEYGDDDAH